MTTLRTPAAAEGVAQAGWELARAATAETVPPEVVHQIAGRLLAAADALGVVARSMAGQGLGEEYAAADTAAHWRAADQGLMTAFSHLYASIPAGHPAREWFIQEAEAD